MNICNYFLHQLMCHGSIILDMTNLQRLYDINNYNYHWLEKKMLDLFILLNFRLYVFIYEKIQYVVSVNGNTMCVTGVTANTSGAHVFTPGF